MPANAPRLDAPADARTRLFAIFGHPIDPVRAPVAWSALFKRFGINVLFLPAHVEPDGIDAAIAGLAADGIALDGVHAYVHGAGGVGENIAWPLATHPAQRCAPTGSNGFRLGMLSQGRCALCLVRSRPAASTAHTGRWRQRRGVTGGAVRRTSTVAAA